MSNKNSLKDKITKQKRSSPVNAFLDNFEEKENVVENEGDNNKVEEKNEKEKEKEKEKDTAVDSKKKNEKNMTSKSKTQRKPKEEKTKTEEENIDLEEEEAKYFWEKIKSGKVEKRKKVFTSFYLDPELYDVLESICDKNDNKKGVKSELLNQSIRYAFKEQGLL